MFLPLFLLTFILLKKDGYLLNWQTLTKRLRLHKITLKDLLWIIIGMIVCSLISVIVIWIWSLLSDSYNLNELKGMSPIKIYPLIGKERFAIILLPIFYFFNYFGEELLWRGYILPRQELTHGKYAWIINAGLHLIFHLSFSIKALIFFIPFMLLMPYITYKRKTTYPSIIIHILLGAPTQLLIALGIFV